MSLETLVTDLLPEEMGQESLRDIWEEGYNPVLALADLRKAENLFPDDGWQGPLAEGMLRLLRKSSHRCDLLLAFLEWSKGDINDQELHAAILQSIEETEEEAVVHSWQDTLRYAEEEWGEETAKIIAECTGVKIETVRRWMSGSTVAKSKHYRVCSTVLLYREAKDVLGPDEARSWLQAPDSDGTSPIKKIALAHGAGQRWIPWEARQDLSALQAQH